jgi:hypothetical protein
MHAIHIFHHSWLLALGDRTIRPAEALRNIKDFRISFNFYLRYPVKE